MASDLPVVLLLHGFAGIGLMNRPLGRMLRKAGYRPVEITYDSWSIPFERICDRLEPRLADLDETSEAPIHFVAHSMGGLVTRALIERRRPRNLGRVVMLGTPHGGSEVADFIDGKQMLRPILGRAGPALVTRRNAALDALLGKVDYPVGIIAGNRPLLPGGIGQLVPPPSDGKVSVASTRLAEAADHIVLPLPHSMLPYHATSQCQVRHFLAHGRFDHGDLDRMEGRVRSA